MTPFEAAMEYANLGWCVVPTHSVENGKCSCGQFTDYEIDPKHAIGKHPYPEGRFRAASKDPVQITTWFMQYPDANVSIATGLKSNLIVLDVDKKNGGYESLALLEKGHSIPKTVIANSGGGGVHYYFQNPPFEVRGRRGMKPGLDVMAEGNGIVAPPSVHRSGEIYTWKDGHSPWDLKPAPLPRWLLIQIQTKRVLSRPRYR